MEQVQKFVGVALCILLAMSLTACGGGGEGGGVTTTYKTAEYFPLGQGDTWTSREKDGSLFTLTISGTETINGVVAVKRMEQSGDYELMTSDSSGIKLYKEYDIDVEGDVVVHWHQLVYSPPVNYLPGEVSIGTKNTFNSAVTYTDNEGVIKTGTVSGDATVEGVEDITVPAGTFTGCLKFKITWNLTSSDGKHQENRVSTPWLAKGVGVVKETGQGTNIDNGDVETFTYTDVLVSATVGGATFGKGGGTIQDAIDSSSNGDIVEVSEGTYRENLTINKEITLRGAGKEKTILIAPDGDSVIRISANNVTVEGFTVDAKGSSTSGIHAESVSNSTVRNSKITGAVGFAGVLFRYCTNAEVDQSIIESNNQNGVTFAYSSGTINGSSVLSNGRNGIDFDYAPLVTITNNTISYNGTNPDFPYHNGIGFGNDSTTIIDGNWIEGNSGNGIGFENSTATIRNNTIINNQGAGIAYINSTVTIENNTMYGNLDLPL